MKSFQEYCKHKNFDLSFLAEKKIRTGLHYPMPTGYLKHEYPDLYYAPRIATAALDIKNFSQYSDKAPPDDAP